MAFASYNFEGLVRVRERLRAIAHPDATPLMLTFEDILIEDNRRGLMAGLDKDGKPMPITQRQLGVGRAQEKHLKEGKRGNLYLPRKLKSRWSGQNGPPLVPQGEASRAIVDYYTTWAKEGGIWRATGAWLDFESRDGLQILPMHAFPVNAPYPRRDVMGLRPWGLEKARLAVRTFGLDLLKGAR